MKRSRKKSQPSRAKRQESAEALAVQQKADSRRKFLGRIRSGLFLLPVLAGIGYFSISSVQATMHEHDLTRIGDGKPSVVQVHDPNCDLCITLQGQARKILDGHEDDVNFMVANISTDEGRGFSQRYGVPHVTLVLFDARGAMVDVVNGPIGSNALDTILMKHIN